MASKGRQRGQRRGRGKAMTGRGTKSSNYSYKVSNVTPGGGRIVTKTSTTKTAATRKVKTPAGADALLAQLKAVAPKRLAGYLADAPDTLAQFEEQEA